MKKWIFITAFLALSTPLFAQDFLAKKQVKLGQPVKDFTLSEISGKTHTLSSEKGKVVMIHFWSAKCPFVVRYKDRLQAIAKDYADKDVVVFGIDSNYTESLEEIRKVAEERQENYPILIDQNSVVADQFGAITTPHVFLIDKEGKLAYEGAVDNQGWKADKKPTKAYVRTALDELLAGKSVSRSKTKTAGCTIKRQEP